MPMNALRLTTELTFGDLFAVLAAGVAVLLLLTRSRPFPKLPLWLWIGGGFLVLSMLMVQLFPPASLAFQNASFPDFKGASSTSSAVKLLGAMIVIPVVIAIVVDSWKTVGLLVNAWLAGVAVSCAAALCDAYFGTGIQLFFAYDADMTRGFLELISPVRHFGFTVHPNALSLTAALSLPLLLAKMTDARRLMMLFPVLLLLAWGILLSGSRIGLVGFTLGVLLTLVVNPDVRKTVFTWDPRVALTVVTGVVASLVLLFFVPLYTFSPELKNADDGPATISRVSGSDSTAEESDSLRKQYFEDSVDYIQSRPFTGWGFKWVEASHDVYLQMLLAGGVLALIGFLTVMLGYLREGWILRNRVPDPAKGICLALSISVAVYLISGILGNGVLDRYLFLAPALILAISMMLSRGSGGTPAAQSSDA